MTHRPLVAIERPPDHGAERTHHYAVYDTARNRYIGGFGLHRSHVYHTEYWAWGIGVPQGDRVMQQRPPAGEADTREEAMAALRAAWDTYPAEDNWPPWGAWHWPAFRPAHMRGNDVGPGQGPWQPGREPHGWRAENEIMDHPAHCHGPDVE